MDKKVVERVLQAYALANARILEPQKGYRNQSFPLVLENNEMLNLIIYKSEPGMARRIQNANHVSNFLHEHGFPVRRTVDSRIVRLCSGKVIRYGALYNYLPGRTIPWEGYTMTHLKLIGAAMSDMHAALFQLKTNSLPPAVVEYKAIVQRMQAYFSNALVRQAIKTKLRLSIDVMVWPQLFAILQACKRLTGQQALHMDFVRGNILFGTTPHGLTISGILDFEKTATGHPLLDISRTLAFLLVDCKYKSAAQVRKYFLYSGYHKRGRSRLPRIVLVLKDQHLHLLEALLNLFLLYDFYKFLRHNPYESLWENEHFVRTRDLLQARGIVRALQVDDRIMKTQVRGDDGNGFGLEEKTCIAK